MIKLIERTSAGTAGMFASIIARVLVAGTTRVRRFTRIFACGHNWGGVANPFSARDSGVNLCEVEALCRTAEEWEARACLFTRHFYLNEARETPRGWQARSCGPQEFPGPSDHTRCRQNGVEMTSRSRHRSETKLSNFSIKHACLQWPSNQASNLETHSWTVQKWQQNTSWTKTWVCSQILFQWPR